MKFFMNISQVFIGHMGVNLGGANVGVAKHCLDGTDIGAVGKQVGGKNMTDNMRSYFFGYAGDSSVSFYNSFN